MSFCTAYRWTCMKCSYTSLSAYSHAAENRNLSLEWARAHRNWKRADDVFLMFNCPVYWVCAHASLSFLVFCCCGLSTSWLNILCVLRCFSVHHSCKEWFFELISHQLPTELPLTACFLFCSPFCVTSRKCCVKNPRRSAVWDHIL